MTEKQHIADETHHTVLTVVPLQCILRTPDHPGTVYPVWRASSLRGVPRLVGDGKRSLGNEMQATVDMHGRVG